MTNIPNWSYLQEYNNLQSEIQDAINNVFSSGRLILGNEVKLFEDNFSRYCECSYGIGLNSGTDAIFLSLKALGVGKGDEVITTPLTAVATISAIRATGATPIFVDIHPNTYLMDTSIIEPKITSKTKVIVPVHLYGQAVDLDPIIKLANKNKFAIIEDCSHAHGAKYKNKKVGSIGIVSAFSFYPTKILGAYGDAGMCVTHSSELAEKLKLLRSYGAQDAHHAHIEGYNSRMDEVQAAILNVKIKYLDKNIARRQYIAALYNSKLSDYIKTPQKSSFSTHSYHLYVVSHPQRNLIIDTLAKNGINIKIHYPTPIHLLEAYKFLGYKQGNFPIAEKATNEIFSLPMYAELTDKEIEYIIAEIKKII